MQHSLGLDFRPSQPHGWPAADPEQGVGATIGGHSVSTDFSDRGRDYRLSLLELSPGRHDPVYQLAADRGFRMTLDATFKAQYAFHYVGGGEFSVQSYSVYSKPANDHSPLIYGADLYLVYAQTRPHAVLRWIQVGHWSDATGKISSAVDNAGRANPFYFSGGPTSIYGRRIVNVDYANQMTPFPNQATLVSGFKAQLFLAEVTNAKDAAGRQIVRIYGGITYGWQVREVKGDHK